jgi:hypothetical protein
MDTGTNIHQGVIVDYWLDEDGILHGISKEGPRNMINVHENFELVRKITGGKKVCAILDITHTSPYDMSTFVYVQEELCKAFKAIAYISRTAIGAMLSSASSCMSVPVKFFNSPEEARNWLKDETRLAA